MFSYSDAGVEGVGKWNVVVKVIGIENEVLQVERLLLLTGASGQWPQREWLRKKAVKSTWN